MHAILENIKADYYKIKGHNLVKIYIEPFWYYAYLFKNDRALHYFKGSNKLGSREHDGMAYFISSRGVPKVEKFKGCNGIILLPLGPDPFVYHHESIHATFDYITSIRTSKKYKSLEKQVDDQEFFCDMAEEITKKILRAKFSIEGKDNGVIWKAL